jgi:PmbA protein
MSTSAPFDAEIGALLGLARERGLADVEVYARRDVALTLRAHQGELESFQRSDSVGVGVRVLLGERVGYAYTENLAPKALERALAEAAGNAELVEAQPGSALADAPGEAPRLDAIYNPALDAVALDDKIARVLELEAITRSADPRVKAVPGCSYSDSASLMRVASTRGLDRHYRSNLAYALVYPIVSAEGENKTCYEIALSRDFGAIDVQDLSQRAVGGALRRLGAQEIASGTYTVVFTPRAMGELLSAFSDVFSAKAALEGKSLLAERLGQAVASERVTILDDALLETGFAARPFDDEGVASRPVALVEGGVFKTFLHNNQTARRMGGASTGHAARGGYKGVIGVAPTNLFVKPGTHDLAALVAGDAPVVVIDDLQGLHAGTNAISGDFSLQAQGTLYEGGVEKHPVHNFTVAGNFLGLLAGVEAVGDDLRFFPHGAYIGSPSIRVAGLSIAGAGGAA